MYGLLHLHPEYLFRLAFLENLRKLTVLPRPLEPQETLGEHSKSYLPDTLYSYFYSSVSGLCWAPCWQMRHVSSALKCPSNLSGAQPVCERKERGFLSGTHQFLHIFFHTFPNAGIGNIYLLGKKDVRRNFL